MSDGVVGFGPSRADGSYFASCAILELSNGRVRSLETWRLRGSDKVGRPLALALNRLCLIGSIALAGIIHRTPTQPGRDLHEQAAQETRIEMRATQLLSKSAIERSAGTRAMQR